MAEILNAHGSKNDIFVTAMTPRDFASDNDLRAFVRRLCDRGGPFGGDGVYFYDAAPDVPQAWFFNPDGSSAEFCGNGMRCLGRVVLDRRGADAVVIGSGGAQYTVRRAATTQEGVRQVSLEHPAVDFTPGTPAGARRKPPTEARLPELDPALEFTAVAIGNPHLVAVVDKYVESDLIAMGERVAARPDVFPAGANLSVLLPLEPAEVFVRTFERGAGLTASCGSGMAASRASTPVPAGSTPSAGSSSATPAGWPRCRCGPAAASTTTASTATASTATASTTRTSTTRTSTTRTSTTRTSGTRSLRATPRWSTEQRSIHPPWPGVTGTRPRSASPTPKRSAPTPPWTSGTPRGCARPASKPPVSPIRPGDTTPVRSHGQIT